MEECSKADLLCSQLDEDAVSRFMFAVQPQDFFGRKCYINSLEIFPSFRLVPLFMPVRQERSIDLSVACGFELGVFNKLPCVIRIFSPLLFLFCDAPEKFVHAQYIVLTRGRQPVANFAAQSANSFPVTPS